MRKRRELFYTDRECLDELTGRNRFDKDDPRPAHPTWETVVESTKNVKRPNGIKGSTKLIRQCKCPRMKKMKALHSAVVPSVNELKTRYDDTTVRRKAIIESKIAEGKTETNIAIYLRANPQLLNCDKCNGSCLEDSVYREFSKDPSTCLDALLCGKVHVPPLDLPKLDDNFLPAVDAEGICETDRFRCYREECSYGTHVCLTRNTDNSTTTSQYVAGMQDLARCLCTKGLRAIPRHRRRQIIVSEHALMSTIILAMLLGWISSK